MHGPGDPRGWWHQVIENGGAVAQRGSVQVPAEGGGTVGELALQEADPLHHALKDQRANVSQIPRLGLELRRFRLSHYLLHVGTYNTGFETRHRDTLRRMDVYATLVAFAGAGKLLRESGLRPIAVSSLKFRKP